MTDGLFHIDSAGRLTAMTATAYEAESLLQELLESHPDLLAGGQMTPEAPRRWALVRREHGVPDHDRASGTRWSVDHLFVDQDAVPTLVEVKRSSDTRIRREVVGQMLDYAANGVRYWPVTDLRTAFESTQAALGRDPLVELAGLSGDPEVTAEAFFARMGDNLRAGRIRMVFVADVIPDELMRITEFLNEQMHPAEVFAVQVKQYRANDVTGTVIVPAVYGRTATASRKSSAGRTADLEEQIAQAEPATKALLDRLEELTQHLDLQSRRTASSVQLRRADGITVAALYPRWNSLDIPLDHLRSRGHSIAAQDVLKRVRAMTEKRLTEKSPSLPAGDVIRHWDEFRSVIGLLCRATDKRAAP